ncbi:UNVERIFIED_CONTAM: hypothetical protein RF648_18990, partial [Kocuria sp. CPCC 205274]
KVTKPITQVVKPVVHAVTHPVQTVTHPLQTAQSIAKGATHLVTTPLKNVPVVGKPAAALIHGAVVNAEHLTDQIKSPSVAVHNLGNLGTRIYHNAGQIGEDIGHGVQHAVDTVGHAIHSAFRAPEVGDASGGATYGTNAPDTAPAAAPNIAVPKTETGAEEQSSSKKKKARAAGKKSLTVARSAGTGVNV